MPTTLLLAPLDLKTYLHLWLNVIGTNYWDVETHRNQLEILNIRQIILSSGKYGSGFANETGGFFLFNISRTNWIHFTEGYLGWALISLMGEKNVTVLCSLGSLSWIMYYLVFTGLSVVSILDLSIGQFV